MVARDGERLGRIGRRQHRVAAPDEQPSHRLPHDLFVFDKQHRLAPRRKYVGHRNTRRGTLVGRGGQIDPDGGPDPDLRRDRDIAPGLRDDAVDRRQTSTFCPIKAFVEGSLTALALVMR